MSADADPAAALRLLLSGVEPAAASSDDAFRLIGLADVAAAALGMALRSALEANDPDRMASLALGGALAAEDLAGAFGALKAHFGALEASAKADAAAIRHALALTLQRGGGKKIETATHAASRREGSWSVVVDDEKKLPPRFKRTKVVPDAALIGATIASGEAVPGARRVQGEPTINILSTDPANRRTSR